MPMSSKFMFSYPRITARAEVREAESAEMSPHMPVEKVNCDRPTEEEHRLDENVRNNKVRAN